MSATGYGRLSKFLLVGIIVLLSRCEIELYRRQLISYHVSSLHRLPGFRCTILGCLRVLFDLPGF